MIRRKPLIWWETRRQIDEIWSSNDRRSSILTPSSFTQETGVSILSDIQNVTSEIGPIQTFAVNLVIIMASTQNLPMKLVMLCQKQVSRTWTSNYILLIQLGVITCPCLWYLLQAQHSSNILQNIDTNRSFPGDVNMVYGVIDIDRNIANTTQHAHINCMYKFACIWAYSWKDTHYYAMQVSYMEATVTWMINCIPLYLYLNIFKSLSSSQHGQVITYPVKTWDEITYPFPSLNGAAVEVWKWISNFIPCFIMDVIAYPCYIYVNPCLIKRSPAW